MTFAATSFLSVQYEDFPGYWIKFYLEGTTTPKSMATDISGDTLLAKAEISQGGTVPAGFIKTVGEQLFIPFVDGSYDCFLFPTEAEADANDTTNAIQIADDIDPLLSIQDAVINYPDLDSVVTDANLTEGVAANVQERTTGNGGGAMWDVVLASGVTPNTFNIVICTGVPTLALVLRVDGVANVKQFGASEALANNSPPIQATIDSFAEGGKVFIPKGTYLIEQPLVLTLDANEPSIILIGDGTGAINDANIHTTIILNNNDDHAIISRSLGGVAIRDISIQDNLGVGRTAGAGVFVERDGAGGNTQILLENVYVAGHLDGFRFSRLLLAKIMSCTASNNIRDGFRLDTPASGSGTSVNFDSCFAHANGNDGYAVDGYQYCSFLNCASDVNGRYGYSVNNTGGVNPNGFVFVGCGAEGNTDDNYHISNMSAVNFIGGSAVTGFADGIHLTNVASAVITGMKISSNTGYGINVETDCKNIALISPNFIDNTAGDINDTGGKVIGINAFSDNAFQATPGSTAVPSYSFGGDTDTGFYSFSSDVIGITIGGSRRFKITTTSFGPSDNGVVDIGGSSEGFVNGYINNYIEGREMTAPSGPAAGRGRLFYQDDGGGKTQLVVRFNTGAIQIIATEP